MVPLPIPPARLVEEEVERLAASDALRRAPSHQRLLHYLVAKRLAGDEAALRETAIALDVFRRDPTTYDPQVDPIVRVNIGRLRERLDAHYANFDRAPRLRIVLPKGRYAPDFVAGPDAAALVADLRAATALAIPVYFTRCFGAERQVARIRELLVSHRLVTLLGPGGGGKTRLAVELANALRSDPAPGDGAPSTAAFDVVAFVPLASCADVPAMHDALRAAFALPASPAGIVEQLARTLAGRRVLLVLDNLEQLLPAATDAVRALLEALPRLHVLATSRIVLGLDGECEFPISPLAQPVPDATLEEMAAAPALALFVDRAAAVRIDFRLAPDNAGAIAQILRTLGGLPLAIELAASRVRSFAPDQMLQRLRAVAEGAPPGTCPGLKLLEQKGVRGGGEARHASMEQVIGWSWAQLDLRQKRTLEAITVFPAGCGAEASAAVTHDADAVLVMDELVQRSLLSALPQSDGSVRFVITEPVREYAHSQLGHARWLELRARQRRWCVDWATTLGVTPSLAAIQAEMPSVLAAMASAVADGAPRDALQLAVALRPALNEVPLPPSGTAHLRKAIAADGDAALRAAACTVLCMATYDQGRHEQALGDAELALSLAAPRSLERARALHAVASLRWRTTRDERDLGPQLDEALAIAEHAAHLGLQASIHALRGFIAGARPGGDSEAEALQRRALDLWERQGNRHLVNSGRYNLAVRASARRAWRDCLDRLQSVCAVARDDRNWSQLSQALNVRGNALAGLRDWPAAHAAYVEAAEVAFASTDGIALCHALWNVPGTLAHLRKPESAARLMAFAANHWQAHFGVLSDSDRRELRHLRRLVDVQIGAARRARLEDECRLLGPQEALQLLRATMG